MTSTVTTPPQSRLAQFIGIRSPTSPQQAAQNDDDWFLPYNGPYETPKPPQLGSLQRGWGPGTDTSDASEDERGRSRRRTTRKSMASSMYSTTDNDAPAPQARNSRVSAPSFLSLDDGGIGESPAPRTSGVPSSVGVISFYDRDSAHHRWSALGGLLKRQQQPRSRTNTLERPAAPLAPPVSASTFERPFERPTGLVAPQPQRASLRGFPVGGQHAYNQYGPPSSAPPAPRILRQKTSEPILSTFGRTATAPPSHPYANMRGTNISRPLGIVHPPTGAPFQHNPPEHNPLSPQPPSLTSPTPMSQNANGFYSPPSQRDPHQHPPHHQPAFHSSPPQQHQFPAQQSHHHLAPPRSGGILRGLKSSLSSPNLRAAFSRLSPSPTSHPTTPKHFEAETWCDAILFPRPRFRAHVISPPGSPDAPAMRERPAPEERSGQRPGMEERQRSEHPLEVIAQEVERQERLEELSRKGSRLRKRSKSAAARTGPPPPVIPASFDPPPDALQRLKESEKLAQERADWARKAERSFANKRSRSLSRSALRNVRARAEKEERDAEYPSVGTMEERMRRPSGVERLAVVAFAQGTGRAPTTGASSSHHSHSGANSRGTNSQTQSAHTRSAQSHSHSGHSLSHRRSESWGRTVVRKVGKTSGCLNPGDDEDDEDTVETMGRRDGNGRDGRGPPDIERVLMRGDTVRLKVHSRESEEATGENVIEIAPSPPHSASAARVTPSPVGLAVSTPEPHQQPPSHQHPPSHSHSHLHSQSPHQTAPEIVIHSHPYSPHAHHPSITSSVGIGSSHTHSSSIAARHRMPPAAAETTTEPGSRMYALSRSGVIREVYPKDLAGSPAPSPALGRGEFPGSGFSGAPGFASSGPAFGGSAPGFAGSPLRRGIEPLTPTHADFGVDRTSDAGLDADVDVSASLDVDAQLLEDERDANGRPISIAPARARRERNVRAYATSTVEADRTSTLGVEEVLNMAFRRMSQTDPSDGGMGMGGGEGGGEGMGEVSVEDALAAYREAGSASWDTSNDNERETPALTRAASDEGNVTLASSKLERSNPSLLNLLSSASSPALERDGSGRKREREGGAPVLLGFGSGGGEQGQEARPELGRVGLGVGRDSADLDVVDDSVRKISDESLGLPPDLHHSRSHSSSASSPRPLGSMDDLELYHDLFWVPNSSGNGNGATGSSPRSALGLVSEHQASPPPVPSYTHSHVRKASAGAGSVRTHTPRGSQGSVSAKVPLPIGVASAQQQQQHSPQSNRGLSRPSPAPLSVSTADAPQPQRIVTRSRSGTFGTQTHNAPRNVPVDVDEEDEEDEDEFDSGVLRDHTVRLGSVVHSISVTTPLPEDEIRSAHPSLSGADAERYAYDAALARLAQFVNQPDPATSLSARESLTVPNSAHQRASYATTATGTTASSNHFSLIENFPRPPTQELMSQAVLGYFALRNAQGSTIPRDDEHERALYEQLDRALESARPRHTHGVLLEEDGDSFTEETTYLSPPPQADRDRVVKRAANRSTFGGEGELADAWEAHPSRGAFRDD